MRNKTSVIAISSVIVLMICFLLLIPGSFTYAVTIPAVTITPSAWVYLPVISNQPYKIIYSSNNLSGHSVSAECNPGGVSSCPCSDADASITASTGFGAVTSNPRKIGTYINAIGHKKFIETFPSGEGVALGVYTYAGEVSLPVLPAPNVNQSDNPQAVHMMIQLWDGRNALFPSNKTTREGVIYWNLNPWTPDYGRIKVYANPITLVDTGITVTPDLTWHTFELTVDLAHQKYVSIKFDSETRDLSHLELARVYQPTWGTEVALIITTESLASWPGDGCPYAFTWTTRFRNLEFLRLNGAAQ